MYNSDISTGGDFVGGTGTCSDGGTLAGYADTSDPPLHTRGSTTQLSALALLKITGVASAKTSANVTGSPTKLTFANDTTTTANNESPILGGQFDGGCLTLTNESVPSHHHTHTGSPASIGDVGALSGATQVPNSSPAVYQNAQVYDNGHGTTQLTIKGGTLPSSSNTNVSIFVNGDIYINGNINYGSGWTIGTAPSLIVHATGNIYIAPGVTHLAGVYIAEEKPDGSAGTIYDCSNSFSPVQKDQLYSKCNNQLVVNGSFVAKQVNLMRTYGSLRDEEPPKSAPFASTACSNANIQSNPESCAGEIFIGSPTLYLSEPATQPPGNGSLQFQSIESLPPVL